MSRHDDSSAISGLLYLGIVLILICRGFLVADSVGIRAAENVGFTDVRLKDAKHVIVGLRGCDAHDAAGFEIRAKEERRREASAPHRLLRLALQGLHGADAVTKPKH